MMYIVDAKDKECGCRGFECRKTCEHVKYVIPIDQYIYE